MNDGCPVVSQQRVFVALLNVNQAHRMAVLFFPLELDG
jgi:hypothetical protein